MIHRITEYIVALYKFILSRDVLGLFFSLFFFLDAWYFRNAQHGHIYGTDVFLHGSGPLVSRLFFGSALVTTVFSLRRVSPEHGHICPSCKEVYLTGELDACFPRCKVPLVLLSDYKGELDMDPPEAGKAPVLPELQAPCANPAKLPDPRNITPIWLVVFSTIPFAFLLRHFSTMTVQSFAVLAFWLAFFLRRALLRSTMAMDEQRRDVLKRRLVRIMVAAVLFSVFNCALLDRIATWIS